jgi:RNA polymerase sigma-70 factor (ECF subfamily)
MDAPGRSQFEACLTDEVYLSAWRYASHLAASREDAEDLLQDSLAHAYRRFAQLRESAAFRSWLLSIIRSEHIRLWRKNRRRSEEFALKEFAAEGELCPADSALPLAEALARLPGSQRELLSLFYIEGLSLNETGRVLRLPGRAVKQRLFRARAALRRLLEPQFAVGDLSTQF